MRQVLRDPAEVLASATFLKTVRRRRKTYEEGRNSSAGADSKYR